MKFLDTPSIDYADPLCKLSLAHLLISQQDMGIASFAEE